MFSRLLTGSHCQRTQTTRAAQAPPLLRAFSPLVLSSDKFMVNDIQLKMLLHVHFTAL